MTKLEEVARAIWHERAKHFGEAPKPFAKDERWELCLSYARAAIEALREPTEEMKEVAPRWLAGDPSEIEWAKEAGAELWNTMIDAILKEEKNG